MIIATESNNKDMEPASVSESVNRETPASIHTDEGAIPYQKLPIVDKPEIKEDQVAPEPEKIEIKAEVPAQHLMAEQKDKNEGKDHWSKRGSPKQTIIWTEGEDKKLFELYKDRGAVWSIIAKDFPGRTENQVKNRFYSTLRRVATKKTAENNMPPRSSIHMSKLELLQYVDDALEYGHSCFSKRGRKKKKAKAVEHSKIPVESPIKIPASEPQPLAERAPAPSASQPLALSSYCCKPHAMPVRPIQPIPKAPPRMPMMHYPSMVMQGPPTAYPSHPVYPPFPRHFAPSMAHIPPRYPIHPSMRRFPVGTGMVQPQSPPTVNLQARLEEIVMMQQSLIGALLRQNGVPTHSHTSERSMGFFKK